MPDFSIVCVPQEIMLILMLKLLKIAFLSENKDMAFKDRGPSSGPGATSWPALCTHSVSGPQLDVNNLTIEAGGQTQFFCLVRNY